MNVLLSHTRLFALPILVLLAGLLGGFMVGGFHELFLVAVLIVFEVALSFNNAVINAAVLKQMSRFWQTLFLTVGLLVAVVGMRLLFPVVIVMVSAGLGFGKVVDLALNAPLEYARYLEHAHVAITSFGATFLLMLFLDFILDNSKKVHWFTAIEAPLSKAGRLKTLSTLLALLGLWASSALLAKGEDSGQVVMSGGLGLITYLVVRGFSQVFESYGGVSHEEGVVKPLRAVTATGWHALGLFVYLEVLDAAFSFDGVVGAFAITDNVITIAIGLGVGAFFVRELTVWLVRHDSLSQFRYLEHGAQYSVGALALLMALSLRFEIPELLTGVVGVGFIGVALAASLMHRSRSKRSLAK